MHLNDQETTITTCQPSLWMSWPLVVRTSFTFVILHSSYGIPVLNGLQMGSYALGTVLRFGVVLWWFITTAAAIMEQRSYQYILTNQRIHLKWGWLSQYHTSTPLKRIDNLDMTQSLTQRLLGVGHVHIQSISGSWEHLLWVRDPQTLMEVIRRAMHDHQDHSW